MSHSLIDSLGSSKEFIKKNNSILQSTQPVFNLNFSKIQSRSLRYSSNIIYKPVLNKKLLIRGNYSSRDITNAQTNMHSKVKPDQRNGNHLWKKGLSLSNSTLKIPSQAKATSAKRLSRDDSIKKAKNDSMTISKDGLNKFDNDENSIKQEVKPCSFSERNSLASKAKNSPQTQLNKNDFSQLMNKSAKSTTKSKKPNYNRNKSVISNGSSSAFSLKKDRSKELLHHTINLNSDFSLSIIGNKIMSTVRDYEEAIQSLRIINSKQKEHSTVNIKSTKINKRKPKNSLPKHSSYSTLLEEKENNNSPLKDTSNQKHQSQKNVLQRQLDLKNEEIDDLEEKDLEFDIEDLGFNINKDNPCQIIVGLSKELKNKIYELKRLKEKEGREKEFEKFYVEKIESLNKSNQYTIDKLKEVFMQRKVLRDSLFVTLLDQFTIQSYDKKQKEDNKIISLSNDDFTNQLKSKETDLLNLQQDKELLKTKVTEFNLQVNELKQCNQVLKEEIIHNKHLIEQLLLKQSQLEKDLTISINNQNNLKEQISAQLSLYDETVNKYQKEFKESQETFISQKASLEEELYQCKIKLEEQNAHQITKLNNSNELRDKVGENNKDKENGIDLTSNSISLQEKDIELSIVKNQLKVVSNNELYHSELSKLEVIKQLKEELSIQISNKEKEILSLIKQIENITESCKILKKINKDKNDIILDLKNKLTRVCDIRSEFEKEITKLKDEIKLLKELLTESNNKCMSLSSELETKTLSVHLKNTQIDNISSIILSKEKEIASLTKDIKSQNEEKVNAKLTMSQLTFSNSIEECNSDINQQVKMSSQFFAVLGEQRYKGLHWYLITKAKKKGKETETYDNTYWIEGNVINEELSNGLDKGNNKEDASKDYVSMLINKKSKADN